MKTLPNTKQEGKAKNRRQSSLQFLRQGKQPLR
jgi:hypothetical protein